MKTFGVAVAVAIMLAFLCPQESSAVLAAEVEELEELMSNDTLTAALEKMSEDSWKVAELKELEALMRNETLAASLEETSEETEEEPLNNRHKRDIWSRLKRKLFKKKDRGNSHRRCRFCCNCNCGYEGCGTCCRF